MNILNWGGAFINYYSRTKEEITSYTMASVFQKKERAKVGRLIKEITDRIHKGTLWATIKRKVEWKISEISINRYFNQNAVEANFNEEKYLYFPLHYQPEATTLPLGGEYYEQILIVELISYFLPNNVKLFVKPHPNRSLLANRNFYNRIAKNENVVLVSPKTNTYELMDNALGVVSITGTVLGEAIVRRKKALMFGDYIWKYGPGVYYCKTSRDVECAVKDILNCHEEVLGGEAFIHTLASIMTKAVKTEHDFGVYNIEPRLNADKIAKAYIHFLEDNREATNG